MREGGIFFLLISFFLPSFIFLGETYDNNCIKAASSLVGGGVLRTPVIEII